MLHTVPGEQISSMESHLHGFYNSLIIIAGTGFEEFIIKAFDFIKDIATSTVIESFAK